VRAAYAVLSFFGGVDFGDLQEDLRNASWPWLIAGAIVAQLPPVTQAVSTRGAIPAQLPFGPVYVMQLATSYMNLALPSGLARMAVSVRFFQRQGVPPAAAITSGTIDSLTNTVVQAVLLVLLLLFSSASLNLNIDAPDTSGVIRIAALLIALAVAVVVGVALSRRAREWIREKVGTWWPQVRDTFRALRGSHKLAQLFLGNIPGGIGGGGGRPGGGPDGGRRTGVGGLRNRPAVPHCDVLSAAHLGLVRAAVAAQKPVSLTRYHISETKQVPYTLPTRCPNPWHTTSRSVRSDLVRSITPGRGYT
jgi:hypothetical protein